MLAKIDGLHTNTSRRDNRKTYYNALIGNNNSNKYEFLEIKFKKKKEKSTFEWLHDCGFN